MLIRLFCAGGASTSILAAKMREAAKRRGLKAEVTLGDVHNLEQMRLEELERADVARKRGTVALLTPTKWRRDCSLGSVNVMAGATTALSG